jgi:hypothetical protein
MRWSHAVLSPQFLINLSPALSGIGLTRLEQITQDLDRWNATTRKKKHPPSWTPSFHLGLPFWRYC